MHIMQVQGCWKTALMGRVAPAQRADSKPQIYLNRCFDPRLIFIGSKCLLMVTTALNCNSLIGSMGTGVDLNQTCHRSLSAFLSISLNKCVLWSRRAGVTPLIDAFVHFEISNCIIEVVWVLLIVTY